ncbi:osmotically inducible protein C [Acidobacteria bacterium Mor1]|nr:osmotically inducible protein C [Acidobacteria bacterium Mor1]
MAPRSSERVRFPGALGGLLAARVERPAGAPRAWALFAHCFSCSKDLKAVGRITRALTERGFGVLRFDFTGLGESDGDFADTNFSSNLDDLVAAADFMRRELEAPSLLIGHSLGGAAVLAGARRIPESRAVATIGAPSDTKHLVGNLLADHPELEDAEEAEVRLGGRPFTVKRQFLEDLREHTLEESIAGLGRALLVMHSPVDETVGIEHAARIYGAARHPKSFVSLDDADHLLLRDEKDARYAAEVLASWAGRYLPADDGAQEPLPEGTVSVRGGKGFVQEVRAGRHRLVADEPQRVGGEDRGPGPYDLLLASLGACTSMTLRMYADRKEWPLEEVEVTLRHRRVHAKDCADCESETGLVDEIEREVEIRGDLDAEQRARLMEIADRCPVHRTLHNEIKVRTRAV